MSHRVRIVIHTKDALHTNCAIEDIGDTTYYGCKVSSASLLTTWLSYAISTNCLDSSDHHTQYKHGIVRVGKNAFINLLTLPQIVLKLNVAHSQSIT